MSGTVTNPIDVFYDDVKNRADLININEKIPASQRVYDRYANSSGIFPALIRYICHGILCVRNRKNIKNSVESYLNTSYGDFRGERIFGKDYCLSVLKHEDEYKALYSSLADDKSREILLHILRYRVTGDKHELTEIMDYYHNQYFAEEIVSFTNDEVFVDCGGFIGDTSDIFINKVNSFSKIYIYEPNPENYVIMKKLLTQWHSNVLDKIVLRDVGVGAERAAAKISINDSGSTVSEDGAVDIEIVPIDEDIVNPVSFIKMDLEGFETEALKGARKHIAEDKPKLAICVYHMPNDLWEIFQYLKKLNPSYRFYLRHYSERFTETVLYAI